MGCTDCVGFSFISQCSGYQPPCPGNVSAWTNAITALVTIITSFDIVELQSVINAERVHATRRGVSLACPGNCSDYYSFTVSPVDSEANAVNYNEVKDANNTTDFCSTILRANRVADTDIIDKNDIDALRAGINGTQLACICNAYCSCNTVCTCNHNCPTMGMPY